MQGEGREAERVQAASKPASASSKTSPGAPTMKLRERKRSQKVPLNTYVNPATQQRIEWLRAQGNYAVTDVVDAALNEFLDRAGVPRVAE